MTNIDERVEEVMAVAMAAVALALGVPDDKVPSMEPEFNVHGLKVANGRDAIAIVKDNLDVVGMSRTTSLMELYVNLLYTNRLAVIAIQTLMGCTPEQMDQFASHIDAALLESQDRPPTLAELHKRLTTAAIEFGLNR